MKKNRMRLLSILCALMMIVGQLPVLAWAELNEASEPVPVADPPVDVFAAVPESAAVPADVIPVIPETPVVTDPNAQIPPAEVPPVVQNQPVVEPAPAAPAVTEPQPQPAPATQPQAAPAAVSEQQVQAAPAAEPKPQEPTAPAAASESQAQQEAPAAASEPKAESAPAETAPASDETVANPSPAAPEEAGQSTETPKSEEAEKPAEADKPADEPNASEETKPTEGNQPSEETNPSEESKPEETTPTAETTEPSETTPTTEDAKPAEDTTTTDTTNPAVTTNSAEPSVPIDNSQPAAATDATDPSAPGEPGQPADQTTDTTTPAEETAPEVPEKPIADSEMKIGDEAVFTIAPEADYKIRIPGQEGKIQIDAESAFQLKIDITDEKDNQTTTVVGEQDKPFQTIFNGHSERTFLLTFSAVSSTATGTVKVKVTKVQKTEDPITPEANETNTEENAKPAEATTTNDTIIPADDSQPAADTNAADPSAPAESDNPVDQTTDTTVPAEEPAPVIPEKPAADHEMNIGDETVFTIAPGAEYKIRIPGQEGRLQIDAESAFPLKVDITDEKGDKTMTVVGEQDRPLQTIFGGRSERTFLLVFSAASSSATGTVKAKVTKVQRTEEPIIPQIYDKNSEEPTESAKNTTNEEKDAVNDSEKDKNVKSGDEDSADQDKNSDEKSEKDSEEKEEGESEEESKEEAEEKSEEEAEEKTDRETEEESEESEPTEEPVTEFTCDLPGAQDISLAETISGLGIVADGDMAAFMADIQNVTVTDPEIVSLTQTEGDWNFRILKDSETQEALTISMADETVYTIATNADGDTETASDDNAIVVSTENNYYLPEDANAYVETLTEDQGAGAVSAVEEQTDETGEASAYQVFDIGVENVDPELYEGFQVELKLDEEVAGKDFRLYQVQDGTATDITDTLKLNSSENADGTQNVTSITFATEEFAQYVLCYSLETFYQTHDGATYKITVTCHPEAGVPAGSQLKVHEILEEDKTYQQYLDESAEKLGVNSDNVTFARFFDIEIVDKNGKKIEPQKPAQVTIALQDSLNLEGKAQVSIVHFADKGTEVITDVQVSEDGTELIYEQGSFSVTGAVVTGTPTGYLKVHKEVTANDKDPVTTGEKKALAGTYEFTVYTDKDCEKSYTNPDPKATSEKTKPLTLTVTIDEDGAAKDSEPVKLPTGEYWIKEKEPRKGIMPGEEVVRVAVTKENTKEKPASADFINNIETSTLAVTKKVDGVYKPKEDEKYTFTVMCGDQYVKAELSKDQLTATYLELTSEEVKYTIQDGKKLTFDHMPLGKYIVTEIGDKTALEYPIKIIYKVNGKQAGDTGAEAEVIKKDTVNVEIENIFPAKKKAVKPYEGEGLLGGVPVGEQIVYQINYINYKQDYATVTIKDKLDKNVEFASASDNGENTGNEVIWQLKNVKPGEKGKVTLTVKVKEDALKSKKGYVEVVNEGATVQVGDDEEFALNTVKNPVSEKPTLKETKPYKGTGVLGGLKVGDSIVFEISYHNYKSEKATIVIKDTLDPNLKFESASNDGTSVEGVVTWTLKDVEPNKKAKVTLTVKVLDSALASKEGPGKVVNNTWSVKVGDDEELKFKLDTIEHPVPEPPVKKETSPYVGTGVLETVNVDDEVTYEISYKNYKTEEATVVITDKLDKNVEFVSADNNGEHKDGTVTWTLANVAAGAEGKVTLTVKVKDGAKKSKKITNKATVQVGKDQKFTTEEVTNPVSNKTTAPETGDDSHNELWLTLLILSLLGGSFFGVTAFKGKKTGKN